MSDTPTGRRVCAHATDDGHPHLLEPGQTCGQVTDPRPRVHWQDWYDPVARMWLPFGWFPHWGRWQNMRMRRDLRREGYVA